MFRLTIYSIVGYAFWLTVVDVSTYVNHSSDGGWLSGVTQVLFDDNQPSTDTAEPLLTRSAKPDNCQADQGCYSFAITAAK